MMTNTRATSGNAKKLAELKQAVSEIVAERRGGSSMARLCRREGTGRHDPADHPDRGAGGPVVVPTFNRNCPAADHLRERSSAVARTPAHDPLGTALQTRRVLFFRQRIFAWVSFCSENDANGFECGCGRGEAKMETRKRWGKEDGSQVANRMHPSSLFFPPSSLLNSALNRRFHRWLRTKAARG